MEAAQRRYDRLYPFYVEVCALTQLAERGEKPGGSAGHAAMYLHGVEIDATAGHPRLRVVPDGASPDAGVGVSVNRSFANANWIAIPGRDEFFGGALGPQDRVDRKRYDEVVARLARSSVYDGIGLTEAALRGRPPAMTEREFTVRKSIGTDFAFTWARTAYAARLPLPRPAMVRLVAYLNALNERAGSHGYRWDALTNNCSHVVHNAVAAAGVWDPKRIRASSALGVALDVLGVAAAVARRRVADLAFPANTFVRLY